MKLRTSACLLAAAIGLSLIHSEAAVFVISENNTNSLFVPTFRDTTGNNANNTTWFGWGFGHFAGVTHSSGNYKLVDGAVPNLGTSVAAFRGSIWQVQKEYKLVSSTSNIYPLTQSGNNPNGYPAGEENFYSATVSINVPINVSLTNVGTGYTTIIVQGNSSTSPFPQPDSTLGRAPGFFSLAGAENVQITYVLGINTSLTKAEDGGIGTGQFWVKYEIEGSATSYDISFLAGKSGNIAGLTVDTYWSPTGYATDIAVVPEPSTIILTFAGFVILLFVHLRRHEARA